jgi:hypothetical protein
VVSVELIVLVARAVWKGVFDSFVCSSLGEDGWRLKIVMSDGNRAEA